MNYFIFGNLRKMNYWLSSKEQKSQKYIFQYNKRAWNLFLTPGL